MRLNNVCILFLFFISVRLQNMTIASPYRFAYWQIMILTIQYYYEGSSSISHCFARIILETASTSYSSRLRSNRYIHMHILLYIGVSYMSLAHSATKHLLCTKFSKSENQKSILKKTLADWPYIFKQLFYSLIFTIITRVF